MNREEAIANLNMISVAFVDVVTKEQRKLIDDTFEMAIKALSEESKIEPCTTEYQRVYMKGWNEGRRKLVDVMEREIAI